MNDLRAISLFNTLTRRVEPVAFTQGLLPGLTHPPRERIGS